jgi:hypothetical protein
MPEPTQAQLEAARNLVGQWFVWLWATQAPWMKSMPDEATRDDLIHRIAALTAVGTNARETPGGNMTQQERKELSDKIKDIPTGVSLYENSAVSMAVTDFKFKIANMIRDDKGGIYD